MFACCVLSSLHKVSNICKILLKYLIQVLYVSSQNNLKYSHSSSQKNRLKELGTVRYLNIKQIWKIKGMRGYIIVTSTMPAGPLFPGTEVKNEWKVHVHATKFSGHLNQSCIQTAH